MAQMLIPADAIAQEALRYLHLLQNLHLLQQQQLHPGRRLVLVLDRLLTPGQDRLHDPGPKPEPNDSIQRRSSGAVIR